VLSDHGVVVAVSRDGEHRFSKTVTDEIALLPGLGVQGDAHVGIDGAAPQSSGRGPTQPNLRQVHLIHVELHAELRELGFDVAAGQMGENILTGGVELLGLPRDTLLQLGEHALVQLTGLRNPCAQIDAFPAGPAQGRHRARPERRRRPQGRRHGHRRVRRTGQTRRQHPGVPTDGSSPRPRASLTLLR